MTEIALIQRIAETEADFRQANEQIEVAAHNMVLIGKVPFICECSDPDCIEIVRLDLEEYEDVREHPRRFFTAPGHAAATVEAGAGIIASELPRHTLADKIGLAGEIAEERYDDQLQQP